MEATHVAKRPRTGERTLLACIGCKHRKLKCDGQSPQCSNCVRTDRQCLVEDPATGLHRPRDYMQTLESHVAHLESLLQQHRPDIAGDHLNTGAGHSAARDRATGHEITGGQHTSAAAAPMSALSPVQPAQNQASPAAQSGTDSHVDDLSSEVALLCINAAGREPHYFGPSSAVSFSRIASQAMGVRASQGRAPSESSAAPQPAGADLGRRVQRAATPEHPSEAKADLYVQAYFQNIHPQYPFLHEPTFNAWRDKCRIWQNADDDLTAASNVATFFVFMVYAIGSLTLGPTHYESAENLYAVALDRITPILDLDSLESIQSILCCAVYSIRSPVGASLWKVSGMAIRHCVELGYHRSASRFRMHADVLTREMSSRCFWVAYDIDRVAANILGRPDGISDHFIDAEYPLDIDDEHITTDGLLHQPRSSSTLPPTSMSGAIHVIKLRRLWSRFSTEIYQFPPDHRNRHIRESAVQNLRRELDDWLASAPETTSAPSGQPRSTFASHKWFRLGYCHSILLLYRPFIMEANLIPLQQYDQATDPKLTETAFQECYRSAKEILILYRKLFQSPTIQLTWGGLHILFMAALTYLYCIWRSDAVRKAARTSDVVSTCMACTTVLVTIAERWPSASSYRNIFETLSARTIDMICGDATPSVPTSSFDFQINPSADQLGCHLGALPNMNDWFQQAQEIGMPGSQGIFQELMQGICEPINVSNENMDAFDNGSQFTLDTNDWQAFGG